MSVDFPHVGRQRGKTITNANKNKTKNSKIKQKTAALHAPSCRTLTAHARTFPNDNNNNNTQTEHDEKNAFEREEIEEEMAGSERASSVNRLGPKKKADCLVLMQRSLAAWRLGRATSSAAATKVVATSSLSLRCGPFVFG